MLGYWFSHEGQRVVVDVAGQVVRATATPVHRGRRTQMWQTRITRADGKLVTVTSQTQMVL